MENQTPAQAKELLLSVNSKGTQARHRINAIVNGKSGNRFGAMNRQITRHHKTMVNTIKHVCEILPHSADMDRAMVVATLNAEHEFEERKYKAQIAEKNVELHEVRRKVENSSDLKYPKKISRAQSVPTPMVAPLKQKNMKSRWVTVRQFCKSPSKEMTSEELQCRIREDTSENEVSIN